MAQTQTYVSEFEQLARHVRQSWINSGRAQAECVALSFEGTFGWKREDLLSRAGALARGEASHD